MATQRYISTSFWDDPWICSLDPSEKFIYLYLMTNPLTNIAGVYEITVRRICFDTGYNNETVARVLERFHEAGKALRWNEYTIIPSWPKHQKWESRKQIQAGIEKILRSLSSELIGYLSEVSYEYPMDTLSIPYTYDPSYLDLDKDIDKDIDKEVTKKPQKHKYGEYKNVLLTDEEVGKLRETLGTTYHADMIIELDEALEQYGYKYKSHYLTILKWHKKNSTQTPHSTGPTYAKLAVCRNKCTVCGKQADLRYGKCEECTG